MKVYRLIGVLLGALGVIFFSAKAIMVKLAYEYDATPVTLMLWRMLFALPVYLLIFLIHWKKWKQYPFKSRDAVMIILLGVTGYYLASFFDFTGLQYISASLERLILFIYPTLVVLISRVVLKTPVSKKQLFAILITYIGVVFIFGFSEKGVHGDNIPLGAILILGSALAYASYLVGSQWLIDQYGAKLITTLAMIVSCIAVVVHQLSISGNLALDMHVHVYGYALLMAVVSTVIPSYLIAESINRIGASDFSVIGSLGPVSTIMLSMIFLGERLGFMQFVGGLIVMSGVLYISTRKKKKAATVKEKA